MDNYEFINTAFKIANDIPTRYQLGGWGNQDNGVYLFDCVCLVKSILWGFNFSVGGHGGAVYLANGVPDVGANRMIELCNNIVSKYSSIDVILSYQIIFENLMKDYKWNENYLKNISNNNLIKKLELIS